MIGREGNDIYIVDDAGDRIDRGGRRRQRHRLHLGQLHARRGSEVESLSTVVQGATDAINLTGNELANTLIGNDGANQLDGGGGARRDGRPRPATTSISSTMPATRCSRMRAAATTSSTARSISRSTNDQEIEGLSTITWEATNAINLTGNAARQLPDRQCRREQARRQGRQRRAARRGAARTRSPSPPRSAPAMSTRSSTSPRPTTRSSSSSAVFAGLGAGALDPNALRHRHGGAGCRRPDRLQQATGQLYFDADGNGAGAAVLFADARTGARHQRERLHRDLMRKAIALRRGRRPSWLRFRRASGRCARRGPPSAPRPRRRAGSARVRSAGGWRRRAAARLGGALQVEIVVGRHLVILTSCGIESRA